MNKAIPSLTGLRFIAAGSVFISHALPLLVPLPEPHPVFYSLFHAASGIGMPLFFVLSGFVIHYNYSTRLSTDFLRGTYNFFVARFARLYPLYFACLVYEILYRYSYSLLTPTTGPVLLYYLTMTQTWVYRVFGQNNLIFQFGLVPQVAWSVSTEWFFYCVYPLVCFAFLRLKSVRAILSAAAVVILLEIILCHIGLRKVHSINDHAVRNFGPVADMQSHAGQSFFMWLFYFSPYNCIADFFLGCLCAQLILELRQHPLSPLGQRVGLVLTFSAVVLPLAVFLMIFWPARIIPDVRDLKVFKYAFALPSALAFLIFCCARYDNVITRVIASPGFVFCGEVSYSIYLLHLLLIDVFRWESLVVTEPRFIIGDLERLVMAALSTVGLAYITYSIVEVPGRRWLTRLLTLKRPAREPAAAVSAPIQSTLGDLS